MAEQEVVIVAVEGELDMASARKLRRLAEREVAAAAAAIVDLSRCPFFDSTAMSTIIALHDELAGRGVPVLVVIPPDPPARRRLATIAALDLAVPIFESDDAALESLAVEGAPPSRVRREEVDV